MQKKLYYIDNEEKNRILNLHENRTKTQYLVENQLLENSSYFGISNDNKFEQFED
jgi:hypothetical protein